MNTTRPASLSASRFRRGWRMLLVAAIPTVLLVSAVPVSRASEDEVPSELDLIIESLPFLPLRTVEESGAPRPLGFPTPATRPTTAPTTAPATTTFATTQPAGPVYDPEESPQTRPAEGGVTGNILQKAQRYLSSKRSGRSSGGGSSGISDLTALPKTDPLPPAKPLPVDFQILRTRSIFAKVKPLQVRERPDGPPPITPTTAPQAIELSLSLTGLAVQNDEYVAFVEDATAAKTLRLHIGDPIARGKVAGMTLMSLDYEARGATTKVMIGQNFAGASSSLPGTRPSVATTPTGPGGPAASGGPPSSGGSAVDILEKLKRKRLLELGGGGGK